MREWRPDLVLREPWSTRPRSPRAAAASSTSRSRSRRPGPSGARSSSSARPPGASSPRCAPPLRVPLPGVAGPVAVPGHPPLHRGGAGAESSGELVYATFGSGAAGHGYDPYRALLDAVAGLDVEVLLTTGAELDLGQVPANVRVERSVPQPEALARAALVVCHGGSGTVLGALAAALPLIVMPMFADQSPTPARSEPGAARVAAPAGLRAAILAPPPPPLDLARELRAAPPPLTALRRAP